MNHSSRLLDTLPNLAFASVADRWALPLVVYDSELRFVYANKAYLEVTNTVWEQIDGQFIFDIFPEIPERRAPVEHPGTRGLVTHQQDQRGRHRLATVPAGDRRR